MSEHNRDELIDFVALAADLGLDAVRLAHLRDFGSNEFLPLPEALTADLFPRVKKEARRLGLAVALPAITAREEARCLQIQTPHLTLDGDVTPCCRLREGNGGQRPMTFGNILEQPLTEIWDLPEYKDFRHAVVSGTFPEACSHCELRFGLHA